ncbi:MAG: hypothetical protein ACREI9_06060 [Nitrospiraceae bacterium]
MAEVGAVVAEVAVPVGAALAPVAVVPVAADLAEAEATARLASESAVEVADWRLPRSQLEPGRQ